LFQYGMRLFFFVYTFLELRITKDQAKNLWGISVSRINFRMSK
jgi:hypothetical protein